MGNKLLLLDFDGIMTNGTKYYDLEGNCCYKVTADIDWTALKLFIARGWSVAFISSDVFNIRLCHSRGFHMYNSRNQDGAIDKVSKLPLIMQEFNIASMKDIVYCGDDASDWPIMKMIKDNGGTVYCPINSSRFIREHVMTLSRCGGEGFLDGLCEKLLWPITENDIMQVQY